MLPERPEDLLLLIRCPSCGQRFKVGDDLLNRTVECGGCEHRFRIEDSVIVRGKKFYPGERRSGALEHFRRVPMGLASPVSAVQYADPPKTVALEPASPLRVIAGAAGAAGMVLAALLLVFGVNPGGPLDGMTTDRRLIMAAFTSLLGISLLAYANPLSRVKALGIGFVMAAGLLVLPLFFTTGSVALTGSRTAFAADPAEVSTPEKPEVTAAAELASLIGTSPLENEIARLANEGSSRKAAGLWLRNLREQNRFLVRDYILRTANADPQSHYYPRGSGDFLMVVTGTDRTLDELAKIAAALGTVERVYPEIQVVEVAVDNQSFTSGSIEKLSDKAHPSFYELNKRELESIDLARISSAVRRLADAEPKIYRNDIARKLTSLLGEPWVDFKKDLCSALMVWSDPPGPAGDAALKEATDLLARGADVPGEMIALIVKEKTPGVVPVIDALWAANPTRWETLYGDAGPAAEPSLLERFPETRGSLRHSAVRVLARVGGPASLPLLEAAVNGADSELQVLLNKAISAIRERPRS